ncbi:MAG: RNA methyltransferase [Pseudomonadota bacterium]
MKTPQTARTGVYKEITSVSNPVIKDLRGLSMRKNRQATNRFMTEGLKLVAAGCEAGWTLSVFLFGEKAASNQLVMDLAALTKSRGGMVLKVSEPVLQKLSRRENAQTVIGIFEQALAPATAIQAKAHSLWVALDGVKDPGNLGTIVRTADAAGATGTILIGETTDPFALEAVRATMGSIFSLPLVRFSRTEFAEFTKNWSGLIVGTHLSANTDYRAPDYGQPAILLMGNEQSGLDDDAVALCTDLVRIPQRGRADSLNLAIATGIMLFEMQRDDLILE